MNLEVRQKIVFCPKCQGDLTFKNDVLSCEHCPANYCLKDGRVVFINNHATKIIEKSQSDQFTARLKNFFKKYQKIYNFLALIFGAVPVNTTAKKFSKKLGRGLIIINLGAGTKILRSDIINVDFQSYPGVEIVADAGALPFKDSSLDAVICDYLLEHTYRPGAIINEIKRVLKIDGLVYIGVPFVLGFHSAPDDYYRWTKQGIKKLSQDFEPLELKASAGPTSALVWVLTEWLATALSFNLSFLYQVWLVIFTIVLAPIKLLDFLIANFRTADNIAAGFYFIGRKK